HVAGESLGAPNVYLIGQVFEVRSDGTRSLISMAMANLAHRDGHRSFHPLAPNEPFSADLEFLPVERVLAKGSAIEVELRGVDPNDWQLASPTGLASLTLHGGADGVSLVVPLLDPSQTQELPRTSGGGR
ncbi:MAG TPA: CocE/NonD family hydrolase C-terminal non-catalytic domain-containing protein, partial [Candidatus Thermoplasmatota archaeon]|nr:CocE/NonD family hydrolase C-terminal non-catalytic domain-containing protein [Candidatus Thermoplasmatota archaeon]